MKIIGTSLAVLCLVVGVIEGNIIDDIILNNWRDKGPVMKHSDPFYNPFVLPFPLFGDMSAEEPPFPDMKITEMTIPDGKTLKVEGKTSKADIKATKADGKTSKGDSKEITKRSIERSHIGKPWFSFSDFLSLPEITRKRGHEGHKTDVDIADKITQTGDLTQTKKPLEGGGARKANAPLDEREHSLVSDDDHKRDDHKRDDHDSLNKNNSKTLVKGFGSSFPKGLSDILIIFQKVGPKTKTHSIVSSSSHACTGFNCRNGICELKKPDVQEELPNTKHTSSVLEHFDRVFLIVIPIVLGIGTVFFVLELRRIYRKMKKQTIVTTFEHQQC